MENANISYDKYALEILGEELCVQLLGKNTITSTGSYAISVDGYHYGLTITGSGSANIMANYYAIFMNKANLMIDNTTITATGESGIIGNTKAERLTIKKSTVRATGNKRGSIGNFDYIELHGCSITKPSGAYIDYEDIYADGDVKLNGELVRGMTVVIEPNSGAGVRNALSENVKIRMQNRQLTVENSARESIAVYNVMGQIIATRHNPGETETFILPAAGVYIVKVGKGVTKIIAW